MTLRDSLLVIAHRDQFPDLAAALALLGVALDTETAPDALPDAPFVEQDCDLFPAIATPPTRAVAADGWSADDIRQAENPNSYPDEDGRDEAEAEEDGTDEDATREGPHNGADRGSASKAKPKPAPAPRPQKQLSVIAAIIDADDQAVDDPLLGAAAPAHQSVPKTWSAGSGGRSAADTAFNIRTLSSTLHSMVRVERESAEPDIDAVVARIATGRTLARVPMIRRRGRPSRICVLCDLHLRSGPYRDDVRYLVQVARRLFSDGALELLTFKGTPANGCGTGPVWTWGSYAELQAYDVTMIIGSGTANRHGDPQELDSFAMRLVAADRAVCVVLIGAEPGLATTRPYPQLLVRD